MLTTEDKEDIRRIIAEMLHTNLTACSTEARGRADDIEQLERLLSSIPRAAMFCTCFAR